MASQKVYIIDEPKQIATRGSKAGTATGRTTRAPNRENYLPQGTKNNSWLAALRAYVLGPISLFLWPSDRGRIVWAMVGVVSVVATLLLTIWWSTWFDVVEGIEHSAVICVVLVALVILSVATAWARAVATSELARWPRLLRHSLAVFTLGLFLPGLGLLIAGHRWKAAFAVWCAGLLVAAIVVAKHWRRLVADAIGGDGLPTHQTIEWILAVAAGCVILGLIAWLVLALDGVRAVSPRARSGSVANWLALTLLVTFVVFLATFRPIPVACDLASTATQLQHQGMRIIPLALFEVATKLDPGTPGYLARSVILYDELGMRETANAKRDLLQRRATQFASAVGAELVPRITHEANYPWLDRPAETIDNSFPQDSWWIKPTDAEYQPRGQ
ncbi:MAG: hypothetical protein JSW58_13770 [Candidatus Latescibacterota bacterium]|nr:MAG: hypothetical protein JSW58_13770 [Candidatus Latescibacterota bacterium]